MHFSAIEQSIVYCMPLCLTVFGMRHIFTLNWEGGGHSTGRLGPRGGPKIMRGVPK